MTQAWFFNFHAGTLTCSMQCNARICCFAADQTEALCGETDAIKRSERAGTFTNEYDNTLGGFD